MLFEGANKKANDGSTITWHTPILKDVSFVDVFGKPVGSTGALQRWIPQPWTSSTAPARSSVDSQDRPAVWRTGSSPGPGLNPNRVLFIMVESPLPQTVCSFLKPSGTASLL